MNYVDVRGTQRILDKLLGSGEGFLYRRVVLATSLWPTSSVSDALMAEYTSREASLQRDLLGWLTKKGAIVQRYDGTSASAESIMGSLLEVCFFNLNYTYPDAERAIN